jgi:hypothetical protein
VLVLVLILPNWGVDPASCKGTWTGIGTVDVPPTWVVDPASCKGTWTGVGTGVDPP